MLSPDPRFPNDDQDGRFQALESENAQLRTALRTRILIEQAKGVLAERFAISLDDAFELLRAASRRARRRIHETAAEVVASRVTPAWLEDELVRRPAAVDGQVAPTMNTHFRTSSSQAAPPPG